MANSKLAKTVLSHPEPIRSPERKKKLERRAVTSQHWADTHEKERAEERKQNLHRIIRDNKPPAPNPPLNKITPGLCANQRWV
ncbi:hypothetical protein NQZ68_021769 [Dissostichus eleginoides]|nr:hypothetical protein NQZ68_021769 [Dissostichus eleginoides]